MRNVTIRKGFTAVMVSLLFTMLMTTNAFAATTYLVQDGAFQNAGFINAGETVEGTIQGPGNWTQLNLGDAGVDAPYLHVIIKAEGGDTAAAQIGVSDLFTYNLADLGVTLTEEYQDVVLPVEENGIMMLSWFNCMGLDGGTVTYTIKDVFLSDDAAPSIEAEVAQEPVEEVQETVAATEVPKTGSTYTVTAISLIGLASCGAGLFSLKKLKKSR